MLADCGTAEVVSQRVRPARDEIFELKKLYFFLLSQFSGIRSELRSVSGSEVSLGQLVSGPEVSIGQF